MNPLIRFGALVVAVMVGYAAAVQVASLTNKALHTTIPVGGP